MNSCQWSNTPGWNKFHWSYLRWRTGSESIPCFILYFTPVWLWCYLCVLSFLVLKDKGIGHLWPRPQWGQCYTRLLIVLWGSPMMMMMMTIIIVRWWWWVLLRYIVIYYWGLLLLFVVDDDDDDLCVWMKAALHPSLSKCILLSSWSWRFMGKCFNVQLKKW